MSKWARIDWPGNWPRPLREVAKDLGWHVRTRPDGPQICLDEEYRHRPVVALRPIIVKGESGSPRLELSQLANWDQDAVTNWGELRHQVQRFAESETLPARLYGLGLGFTTAPALELPKVVGDFLGSRLPELVGGTVLLVEAEIRVYYMQLTVAKLLYRATHLPHLFPGEPNGRHVDGGRGLDSHDLLGGGLFLQPAAAAMSPMQLGFVAGRVAGCLFLCYPRPMRSPENALPRTLAELLQPHYFVRPPARLEPLVARQAVDIPGFIFWWVERLNGLLGQLLNPATHCGRDGIFSPAVMIARFVSLERLLSCVQGILVETAQNDFVRMSLLFDVLDLLDNIGGGLGGWNQLINGKHAQGELERLNTTLAGSKAARDVVLPRCERGVAALLELRDTLLPDDRSTGQLSGDSELYKMLRALRNAGHGLAGGDGLKHLHTLMGKGAQIPPDLPDLAWFHLMRALCFADWSRG